jgi:hypothetical protein
MEEPTVEEMIEELEAKDSGLSPWELDFVDSVRGRFDEEDDDNNGLTEKQVDKLKEVWERHCQ